MNNQQWNLSFILYHKRRILYCVYIHTYIYINLSNEIKRRNLFLSVGHIACFGTLENPGACNHSQRFLIANCSIKISCSDAPQNREREAAENIQPLCSSLCWRYNLGAQWEVWRCGLEGRWARRDHKREPEAYKGLYWNGEDKVPASVWFRSGKWHWNNLSMCFLGAISPRKTCFCSFRRVCKAEGWNHVEI